MSWFRWQSALFGVLALICSTARATLPDEANSKTKQKPRTTFRLPIAEPTKGEHALMPLIRHAEAAYLELGRNVRDYSCVMVRRERIDGRLRSHEFIYAKVRHRRASGGRVVTPFSVYLKFAKPANLKDREVLFVEGQNEGQMFARRGGKRLSFFTTKLDPNSELALRENRYPITEFGIKNLLGRLIIQARTELKAPCEVRYLTEAKINGRPASGIIIKPLQFSSESSFYRARVFVDNELNIPIHYESYAAPKEAGGEPRLLEQYTYTRLKLNVGFNDIDFDADNPNYHVK